MTLFRRETADEEDEEDEVGFERGGGGGGGLRCQHLECRKTTNLNKHESTKGYT